MKQILHPTTEKNFNRGMQLRFVREYRGYIQSKLSKQIKGLSQPNLSKFEQGYNTIGDELLIQIMKFLDFPVEFLDKKTWMQGLFNNSISLTHGHNYYEKAYIKRYGEKRPPVKTKQKIKLTII